ncbi:MAG: RagB/SusD family nutrient uptake outer membrane protein, partial [Bacteroidales bacterium]|nr:RagB/SusD family nutrient uptake outer membrane protein [Bacteroidales bacterium]
HAMMGNWEKAVSYLDRTRTRAGLQGYEYTTEMDLIREIQNERARELGGEFQRKFDLVRWGIWYEVTLQYNEEARVRSNIRRCHRFYPIPDTECSLSGGVLTNDEYNSAQ